MADNTQLNPGSGGDIIRTIQRPTAKTQVLQVDIGGEAGEQLVVGSMPVSGTIAVSAVSGTVTVAGTSTVSGTVAVSAVSGTVTTTSTITLPSGLVSARSNFTGAQADQALVTPAGGQKVYVTRLTVSTANSNTVDVSFRIGTGTTNTPTGSGVILSHPGLANNQTISIGDGLGVLGISAVNGDPLRITCSAPTGGSIEVDYETYVQ